MQLEVQSLQLQVQSLQVQVQSLQVQVQQMMEQMSQMRARPQPHSNKYLTFEGEYSNMQIPRGTKRGRGGGRIHEHIERGKTLSDLPAGVLEMIMAKLFYTDQLNLRAVCKSWSTINGVPPLKQMPWLMTFDDDDDEDEYSWSFLKLTDPIYKKTYTVDMNIIKQRNLKNIEVHESKYGWLLISESQSNQSPSSDSTSLLFLYSPFLTKNNLIELPVLSYPFCLATFSSNPSSSSSSSKDDLFVLAMNSISDHTLSISSYRRGEASWVTRNFDCNFPLSNVKSLVYSNGIFYCSNFSGTWVFDVAKLEWRVFVELQSEIDFSSFNIYMAKSDQEEDLKEDDGEFFLIYLKDLRDIWSFPLWVYVFRLDRLQMIWKRIFNLDKRVVVLGSGCTSFIREAPHKEMESRIYYCTGLVLKHFTFNISDRCYPCTKHYGSLARRHCRKIWIEPPQ